MYLIFYTYEKAEKALAQIDANMRLPDKKGTETWEIVRKAHKEDIWFFQKPSEIYMELVVFDEERQNVANLLPIKEFFHF